MRTLRALCVAATFLPTLAFAANGKPDFGGYVGTDSLNPQPKLPASFLAITDVSGYTDTSITLNPSAGDDQTYAININGAGLYGTALSNCRASDNGYITCQDNNAISLFDNTTLPDGRFGDRIVIAPYFDDLAPIAGTSKLDVYTTAGTAIVQWSDYTIVGKPTARLTFRVIFTSAGGNRGSVTFQYLQMTNGADGSSATIGIQRGNASAWNQYAANTPGSIVSGPAGATALQAILFGYDSDGDRLSDRLENALGTNPAQHDSDSGGLDDGAEVAAGKDPLSNADDGPNTDSDGDGVTDGSEAFYGTNPASVDSDGDSTMTTQLHDGDELYTRRTDPTLADTDGDNYDDGAELDAATDPLDPNSVPSLNLNVNNVGKSSPRAAVDANGMIHIVAASTNNNGVYYWMVDPSGVGKVKIPETFIKVPRVGSDPRIRRPIIRTFGGKVFITYELVDKGASSAVIAFVRVNPANAPQDGSPVSGASLVEALTWFAPTAGQTRQHDMQINGDGVHVVFMANPSHSDRQSTRLGVGYALLSVDGVAQRQLTLPLPPKANNMGVHKRSAPSLVLGSDGTAHIVFLGTAKKVMQSSIVWSAIKGGTVKTVDIPVSPPLAFATATMQGSLIYVFGSGARIGKAQLMVIDTANVTSTPVGNDFWLAPAQADANSMFVAPSPVACGGKGCNAASLTTFANGTSVGYFSHGRNGTPSRDICLVGFLNNGAATGAPYCVPGASNSDGTDNDKHGTRHIDLIPVAGGSLVFFYNAGRSSSVFMRKVPISRFDFPANLPTINTPPRITSTPPSGSLRAGQTYTYAATATDAETPSSLSWSLSGTPPSGMSVSTSGTVTWTPMPSQLGSSSTQLQVCDGGSPNRCVTQTLALTVVASGAPVIVSAPPTNAQADTGYSYQVVVQDPQNNVTSYALTAPATPPGNMALSSSGLFTWTPTVKDVGSTVVTLTVTDSVGLTASQTFTILTTVPMTIDPRFTSTPSTVAMVGVKYVYTPAAVDPGDSSATFTFSLQSTPSGNMALSSAGTLTWTPSAAEVGSQAITIRATSSSGRVADQSVAVTVLAASTTPTTTKSGGCSCDIGGDNAAGAWWMLALVAIAIVLRRRRA